MTAKYPRSVIHTGKGGKVTIAVGDELTMVEVRSSDGSRASVFQWGAGECDSIAAALSAAAEHIRANRQ